MPTLRNSAGDEFEVSDVDAVRMHQVDPSLTVVGDVRVSPDETGQAPVSINAGLATTQSGVTPATATEQSAYSRKQYLKDKTSTIGAAARGTLSGATFGLSDRLFDPEKEEADAAWHPFVRGATEVAGAVLPGLVGDEASLANLARDPISAEHAASALSSKFLYAGEIGGEANSAAKLAEKGLVRAGALHEGEAAAREAIQTAPDLAGMDLKGLKAARETELERIEAARVPERAQLVDDLNAFRRDLKEDKKIFLATSGIKETALPEGAEGMLKAQEIGKTSLDADRQIDRLLRNPKALAERPQRALDALQQQENALEQLAKREPTLRPMYAADESGTRAAALDAVPNALERNRSLQQRIRGLLAEPASERLTAIDAAKDTLSMPAAPKSLAESMLGGSVMGHVAGLFSGMPIVGPMLGAKAGRLATDLVFGRLGKATGELAAKTKGAVESFLNVAKRSPAVPVLATRTLARVAFAPRDTEAPQPRDLAGLYQARSSEVKSQTAYDPATGQPVMRPDARQAMASRLAPLRAANPPLADRIEAIAARRVEFLSSKLPRRPDLLALQTGPDHWPPSDLEMRQWARYVAAVEDPAAVEHRVAAGTVTPEDAEAYHAVYPERAQAFKTAVLTDLPTLRKALPYQRRIALAIFSGVPVDPAMSPNILVVLQGGFDSEPGSDGGTQAPKAAPQFGSVKKSIETPTPAQHRSQG